MLPRAQAKYANTVNMITSGTWTVPAGVSTVYANAATEGGGVYYAGTQLNAFASAGGGGAAIFDAPITVSEGQVLTLDISAGDYKVEFTLRRGVTNLFTITSGEDGARYFISHKGGEGGGVRWWLTDEVAAGGIAGEGPEGTNTNGGNGQVVALTGGGIIMSGGGGGGGGTILPARPGTNGGGVGPYAGQAGINGFGGSGGGFFPGRGQTLLTPAAYAPASEGTTFILLNY